jgi:hypothetical protein
MPKIKAFPGCPSLDWFIARRVTNPYADEDCLINISGRRGSGKSTASLSLAEGIAECIAYLRDKNEPPEKFFNINNVRSVSPDGCIDLFSGDNFGIQENSVYLIDDTGTQYGSRRFYTDKNIKIGEILQVCRIYRCVVIFNFISEKMIDLQGRLMQDVRVQMLYKNTKTQQAVFKAMYNMGIGKKGNEPYAQYFRWNGKRITRFIIERPSPELEKAYKDLRRGETDKFIRRNPDKDAVPVERITPRAQQRQTILKDLVPKVKHILDDPAISEKRKSEYSIGQQCHVTRYWAGLAISKIKRQNEVLQNV